MASSAALLDLALNTLEGQNLDCTNFSPLYIERESGQTGFIEKVLGPHMWSV